MQNVEIRVSWAVTRSTPTEGAKSEFGAPLKRHPDSLSGLERTQMKDNSHCNQSPVFCDDLLI